MIRPTRPRRRRALLLGAGAVAMLLGGCRDDLPQSTLNPAGPAARDILDLFFPVFWIAVGVFVVVEALIVFAAIRYRVRKGREANPVQVHGNTKLEVVWTAIPAIILAVIAVPTIGTIFELARVPTENVMRVKVIGHQWWWEFQYPDEGIVTANELRVPVGTTLDLTLVSQEVPEEVATGASDIQAVPVIHSFWVPRLGGKIDVIPGRTNRLTLKADRPGRYIGQCAEFCGLAHSWMQFELVAEERAKFDEWVRAMKQTSVATTPEPGSLEEKGAQLFQNFGTGSCLACHQLDGTQGGGAIGPSLALFGRRGKLGAGMFPNTPESLAKWLDDPRSMKPGIVMPDYGLSEDQVEALVAYLHSLK